MEELWRRTNGKMDAEGIKMAFDILDSDGRGVITSNEVKDIFQVFHIKEEEAKIDKMIKKLDTEGKGGITFPQFQQIIDKCSHKIDSTANLQMIFNRIDKDKSGKIDVEELKEYTRKIGQLMSQEELEEMVAVADEDGDGEVNFEEFLKMVT